MGLQLTRGGEYAVRAMTYLARYPVGQVSSLRDVGREQDIPESFLAKIFQSLSTPGLVTSQRGAHGGFSLARPAGEITVREVVEAVDGPDLAQRLRAVAGGCQRSGELRHARGVVRAQERMMGVLDDVTPARRPAGRLTAPGPRRPLTRPSAGLVDRAPGPPP